MNTVDKSSSWRTRQNNMDGLRLLFSLIVMLYHAAVLSRARQLSALGTYANPGIAVAGFFVISGYLIFASYEHSSTIAEYADKRARRILPAYVLVIFAIAFLGSLLTTLPLADYIGAGLAKYLAANLVFLNFLSSAPPGIFMHNFVPAADGALWTIKVEVMFYASVPLIHLLLRGRWRGWVLISVYLFSYIYYDVFSRAFFYTGREVFDLLAKQLPGQLSY